MEEEDAFVDRALNSINPSLLHRPPYIIVFPIDFVAIGASRIHVAAALHFLFPRIALSGGDGGLIRLVSSICVGLGLRKRRDRRRCSHAGHAGLH